MDHIVSVQDAKKKYLLGQVDVWALRGVSLDIRYGEFVTLTGHSGSGKSTLLNLIGALDFPSEGQIFLDGIATAGASSDQLSAIRAKKIGFVFQNFNLLPVLTAAENVEYPLYKNAKLRRDEREKMVYNVMEKVGLEKFLDHRPDQLSGGQRQRVAIARALVHNPSLIIADEPTANLDKKNSLELFSLLLDINRNDKVTLILSSHTQDVINRSDRVIRLSDGLIAN